MFTVFRWMLRLFTGLIALTLLALVILYYFLSRSIPDYSEAFSINGLSAPVESVRNNDNVPQIFGATDQDV